MPSLLPTDDNTKAIPVMGYKDGGAKKATLAANAKQFSVAGTKVISVYASAALRFKFSNTEDDQATAADHLLPAQVYLDMATKDKKFVSFFGTGDIDISERE